MEEKCIDVLTTALSSNERDIRVRGHLKIMQKDDVLSSSDRHCATHSAVRRVYACVSRFNSSGVNKECALASHFARAVWASITRDDARGVSRGEVGW